MNKQLYHQINGKLPEGARDLVSTTITAILVILTIGMFALLLHYSLASFETQECHRWNKEAETLPDYYFTPWQVEQCKANGITLTGAPVRVGL